MQTTQKTKAAVFFHHHPEVRSLLQNCGQVILTDDDGRDEAVLLSYADYEKLLWNNYFDELIKRADAEKNDPAAKEYSCEEFFELAEKGL